MCIAHDYMQMEQTKEPTNKQDEQKKAKRWQVNEGEKKTTQQRCRYDKDSARHTCIDSIFPIQFWKTTKSFIQISMLDPIFVAFSWYAGITLDNFWWRYAIIDISCFYVICLEFNCASESLFLFGFFAMKAYIRHKMFFFYIREFVKGKDGFTVIKLT